MEFYESTGNGNHKGLMFLVKHVSSRISVCTLKYVYCDERWGLLYETKYNKQVTNEMST